VRAVKAVERKPSLKRAMTPEQFCATFCVTSAMYDALKRCRIPMEYAAQWRVDAEPLRLFAQRWLCR
jgi:hypothetical protein